MTPDIDVHHPDRQRICFRLENGRKITVCIRKGQLRVEAEGQLSVHPSAPNVLTIRDSSQ